MGSRAGLDGCGRSYSNKEPTPSDRPVCRQYTRLIMAIVIDTDMYFNICIFHNNTVSTLHFIIQNHRSTAKLYAIGTHETCVARDILIPVITATSRRTVWSTSPNFHFGSESCRSVNLTISIRMKIRESRRCSCVLINAKNRRPFAGS